jgi:hypothetical protein
MKTEGLKNLLLGAVLVFASAASLHGQNYSIDWHKVSGGGGASSNAPYVLSGTIGQYDAGGPMTGGGYSLYGGFWALYALQTPGVPLLTITHSGNSAIVSWLASATGFMLQTNGNVATTNWVNYGGTVTTSNGTNSVIFTPPKGNLYFRLMEP